MDAREERQLLSPDRRTGPRLLTPAIAISLVLLVASAAAAVTFVTATGGLRLAGSVPSPVAVASASPAPTSVEPTPTPETTVEPTATPTPAPTPTPTPTPSPTPTPAPSSDRYKLLTPCPDKPDCYLYTIRAGDNLQSIANYFGIPYPTVRELNPNLRIPIHAGDVVILPPPTR
ncbi:MAG: LysM peptidoglycan-binding domain-containing protein [Chloroflexota bacterium]|nr:MAG: LysM peptidoglycan-binding domain-containing protein [Chloroflexota bacterium]